MQQIRFRASWMEPSGRYDPEETQVQLERLEQTMHSAHERGPLALAQLPSAHPNLLKYA